MLPFSFSQNCATTTEYKVYFKAPNEEEEIRCLLINGLCRFDYVFLRQKVTELFPILKQNDFALYWKDIFIIRLNYLKRRLYTIKVRNVGKWTYLVEDKRLWPGKSYLFSKKANEEGDKIRIRSNDDLIIVVSRGNSRVKKLYVTLIEQKDNLIDLNNSGAGDNLLGNLQSNGPVVHDGVTCDGCQQKPLQGYRYKCIVCPDFDLCVNCEKTEEVHSHHPMIRFPVPVTSENFYSREYEIVRNNINGILQMFNQ